MDDPTTRDANAPAEGWHPQPKYRKLALHRWDQGQVLHRAQFDAQEAALLEHLGLRAQLWGLPSYGVARLPWNDAKLASGDLSLDELTVVLPSGLLIDVPGNAELTLGNPLERPAKGAGPVSVYLRVWSHRRPDDKPHLGQYKDDERGVVVRSIYQIEISPKPQLENVQEQVKLADLTYADDHWALGPYVPPLLQLGIGATPFLRDTFDQVVTSIAMLQRALEKRAADSHAADDPLAELHRVLAAVYRVRALLADHGYGAPTQTVALHPYYLFAALREFYLEAVAPQRNAIEDSSAMSYRHDNLHGCFGELASRLTHGLAAPTQASARLKFRRDGHLLVAKPFPKELRDATDVFLVIENIPQTADLPWLNDIKLASPRRSEMLEGHVLEGVPRVRLPPRAFAPTYGRQAVVFQLDTNNREWREAVAEGALCFAVRSGLEMISAALFWQSPGHD